MFCGCTKEMLEGLSSFHLELITHGIIERSKKKNKMEIEMVDKEIEEMDNFLNQSHLIKDLEARELIVNLVKYVQAFYLLIKKRGLENYSEVIKNINSFYFEMDRKFYGELEGQPDDMKKLAEYLDTIKI